MRVLLDTQALVEAVPVVSSDAQWDAYPVQRLWQSGSATSAPA